jgi:hypothetical protein
VDRAAIMSACSTEIPAALDPPRRLKPTFDPNVVLNPGEFLCRNSLR